MKYIRTTSILFGLLACIPAFSQLPDTVAVFRIDSSAIVTAEKRNDNIRGDLMAGLEIDMQALVTFPKVLGTADPLKYAQALPGVSTNSDWECGLKVQGCESSQSVISLCNAPVYGQGHILGLFSVFNPGHFKSMSFNYNTDSRRLGGELGMETSDTLFRALHGEGNLGPVSTHLTLSFPTGKKSSLTLSGRRSFIDLFYKNLLKIDGNVMTYKFYDLNASYLWKMDKRNTFDVNAYFGQDYGKVDSPAYGYTTFGSWGNAVGNVRWRHDRPGLHVNTQLYGSYYYLNGGLGLTQNAGNAEDYIFDIGLTSKAHWEDWEFAAEFNYYNIQPQNIYDQSSTAKDYTKIAVHHALLSTLRAAYDLKFNDLKLKPGVTASLYADFTDGYLFPRIDPELRTEYNFYNCGRISLDIGYKHQYLFMTGLTNSGFPVEFWLGSGTYSKPQASLYGTLTYVIDILNTGISLNLQAYGKKLWNIVEYTGYVSDILSKVYDLKNMLLSGQGYNYGASIQIQKSTGKLTGWIGYSWGRSRRQFDNPDFPGVYPSSYEREHELNAVASYKIGRMEFGGNFIFASGVPYTPVTAAYFLNNDLMVKYGERNSQKLSPYIRLDLSVSCNIHTKGRYRDGINISVQNVTARKNQMMATLKIKDGTYSYAPLQLIIPILPSINYYCTF